MTGRLAISQRGFEPDDDFGQESRDFVHFPAIARLGIQLGRGIDGLAQVPGGRADRPIVERHHERAVAQRVGARRR